MGVQPREVSRFSDIHDATIAIFGQEIVSPPTPEFCDAPVMRACDLHLMQGLLLSRDGEAG